MDPSKSNRKGRKARARAKAKGAPPHNGLKISRGAQIAMSRSASEARDNAMLQLANSHKQVINTLASLKTNRGGAFGNLGSDVDSMIEHGQEAWSAVKRLLNVEDKYVDIHSSNNLTYTGTQVAVSTTSQGDTDNTRDGDSIKGIDVEYYIRVGLAGTALTVLESFYWALIQSHDEAVTPGEVNVNDGNGYAPFYMSNPDYEGQYTILASGRGDFGPQMAYATPPNAPAPVHTFHGKVKCPRHIQYPNGGTAAVSGDIQLMLWGGQATTSGASYVASLRLRFVDN